MPFCGNCKSHHANAAAVRACYQGRQTTTKFAKTHQRSLGAESMSGRVSLPVNFRPPTDKMINFIVSLAGQIATASGATLDATLTEPAIRESVARGHLSNAKAHETIDSMLALLGRIKEENKVNATVAPAPEEGPDVPSGRYALRTDDIVKFYKYDVVTEGKWAGRTFLSAQASDDLHPIRNAAQKSAILGRIAADIRGAMALYGQELGECGMCGRTLTDETSREIGIGPVCREKF